MKNRVTSRSLIQRWYRSRSAISFGRRLHHLALDHVRILLPAPNKRAHRMVGLSFTYRSAGVTAMRDGCPVQGARSGTCRTTHRRRRSEFCSPHLSPQPSAKCWRSIHPPRELHSTLFSLPRRLLACASRAGPGGCAPQVFALQQDLSAKLPPNPRAHRAASPILVLLPGSTRTAAASAVRYALNGRDHRPHEGRGRATQRAFLKHERSHARWQTKPQSPSERVAEQPAMPGMASMMTLHRLPAPAPAMRRS